VVVNAGVAEGVGVAEGAGMLVDTGGDVGVAVGG
jgi:hypothetical protein